MSTNFLTEHLAAILFYTGVFFFVFINKKRFDIHFKVVALYRTQWGVRLMDQVAVRFREAVKLLGYIGVGIGFAAMLVMLGFLVRGLYNVFFVPSAPPTLSPVLPGVHIPGGIFIPLWQGLIAIFIIAVLHEFAHGVVARAHHIRVKNAGPAIVGPFFAAFVEPDEAQMKKQSDIVQYSVFAAGSFTNMLLAVVVAFFLVAAFNPMLAALYPAVGVTISGVEPGFPAAVAGMSAGELYDSMNGKPLTTVSQLVAGLGRAQVGDTVQIGSGDKTYALKLVSRPDNPEQPFMGVLGLQTAYAHGPGYGVLSWIGGLLSILFALSLGIGFANLLPIGPLDGGRMFHLAALRIGGDKKGVKIWARVSVALLVVIFFLLTPIFRETGKALLHLVS